MTPAIAHYFGDRFLAPENTITLPALAPNNIILATKNFFSFVINLGELFLILHFFLLRTAICVKQVNLKVKEM